MQSCTSGFRRRLVAFHRDESGAAALFAVVSLMFLVVVVAYVHNVGMTVNRRIRLQNAADAAAFSGAMVQANSLSAIAWLNSCQTYIYARMQEAILEMMPLATGAATVQWGRHIYGQYKDAPVSLLYKSGSRNIPKEYEEKGNSIKRDADTKPTPNESVDELENDLGEMNSIGDELQVLGDQKTALESEVATKESVRDRLRGRIDSLDARIESIEEDGGDASSLRSVRAEVQSELSAVNRELTALYGELQAVNNEIAAKENRFEELDAKFENYRDQAKEMEGIAWNTKEPNIDESKLSSYWGNGGSVPNDPPPVTDSLMFVPVVGDFLGSLFGKKYAGQPKYTFGQMLPLTEEYPDDKDVPGGAPPWDELKKSMAGYFPGAVEAWQAKLFMLYNEYPKSSDDVVRILKEKALKSVKTWVGERYYLGGKPTPLGVRPGETWIRQLSVVAASIAEKMPEMVRNEIAYSVSVNAPPRTYIAMYPDPDEKWGKVAFAEYDRDNPEAFFRFDHFAMPESTWTRPPYWTNSYPVSMKIVSDIANTILLATSEEELDLFGFEADLKKNNPSLWESGGDVYGNRFLHEARRQNIRMRSITIGDILSIFNLPSGLLYDFEIGTAYAENDKEMFGYPGHYRMNLAKSFYYDEYKGEPGFDKDEKVNGFALRTAVTGWNRNDRRWAMERHDPKDRTTRMFTNPYIGSSWRVPIPWLIRGRQNPNFNKDPRCTLGYAPGRSIPLIGHVAFLRSSGNIDSDDDAVDGHWHSEHYHAHSVNCTHSFPNTFCKGVNCAFWGLVDFIRGSRSSWEGNSHAPYKHWDGYTGDDKLESSDAASYHIHCDIADENTKFSGFLGFPTSPPEYGSNVNNRKAPERLPLSLYNICMGCSTTLVWPKPPIYACVCRKCGTPGKHGSIGSGKFFKDLMPLYNTPVLWINDYHPHWLSAIGAWLTWGDIEGDPGFFFGCGDPYFYDWLYLGLDFLLTESDSFMNDFMKTLLKGFIDEQSWKPEHDIYALDLNAVDSFASILSVFKIKSEDIDRVLSQDGVEKTLEFLRSKQFVKIGAALTDSFYPRSGHHRFLVDPLTMGKCPLCGKRHLGGDWGPSKVDLNGMLDTGDGRVDGGVSYAHVLMGHDLIPGNAFKYGKEDPQTEGFFGQSDLDFDFDIDDGLVGYSPLHGSFADWTKENKIYKKLYEEFIKKNQRHWTQNFAADRFVREWMAPCPGGDMYGIDVDKMLEAFDENNGVDFESFVDGLYPRPDVNFAPAVVMTENFFRHSISVVLVTHYRPVFDMFGSERTLTATATARVGFLERDENSTIGDGYGAGELPQIITGTGETGADGFSWDLDRVWAEFIDFPNHKPQVESNLYYANWGAKLVSTRYAILANSGYGDNGRRGYGQGFHSEEEAEIHFWKTAGGLRCYLPDGSRPGLTLADVMLPNENWERFASDYVRTRREMEGWIQ